MSGRPQRPPGAGGAGHSPSRPGRPTRPVYSTERPTERRDAACHRCGADPCRCEPWRSVPAAEHDLRVRREKSGRGGKMVTVAGPLALVRADAEALLAGLKRRYGVGGSLRTAKTAQGDPCFDLELQGDHADKLLADLQAAGYRGKRAGG